MEMAAQLARHGLCSSFDEAMKWTPRKMFAVLFVDAKLSESEQRQQLALHTMAARGDPKAIKQALKEP